MLGADDYCLPKCNIILINFSQTIDIIQKLLRAMKGNVYLKLNFLLQSYIFSYLPSKYAVIFGSCDLGQWDLITISNYQLGLGLADMKYGLDLYNWKRLQSIPGRSKRKKPRFNFWAWTLGGPTGIRMEFDLPVKPKMNQSFSCYLIIRVNIYFSSPKIYCDISYNIVFI